MQNALKIPPNGQRADVKSQSLTEIACQKLLDLIWQKKLLPGQRLIYDNLERELEMSRTPIINALTRLEQQGFTIYQPYRGFILKPMDAQELWDTFDLREALEVHAVKLAVQLARPEDFDILEEKLVEHENYRPPLFDRKKRKLALQFHLQIVEMSKNALLIKQYKNLMQHLFLRAELEQYNVNRREKSSNIHRALLKHMKNKDIIGSADIMCRHIQKNRDNALALYNRQRN